MMDVSNLSNEVSVNEQHDTAITPLPEAFSTPTRKKIRYPGDISNNLMEKMTPTKLKQSVRLLRELAKKRITKSSDCNLFKTDRKKN
ncbi:unnamed protein product [Lasius platythorax]|uniref:Uncharacterized protein n=1 Tax=Lasius platythorax TaxID=488582 RepID=A0AAV2MX89_9HYME